VRLALGDPLLAAVVHFPSKGENAELELALADPTSSKGTA
jgi:hypothetical protein